MCVVGNGEIAWVGLLKFYKEHLNTGKNKLDIDKLLEVKGIAILDENELKFSGYGTTLPGCEMTFPDFEYLKSGLLDKPESVKNYFRKFKDNEIFSMDNLGSVDALSNVDASINPVTIVKSDSGKVFGGYTDISWNIQHNGYYTGKFKSFIFNKNSTTN